MNSKIKQRYIKKFGAIPSGPLDPSPYSDEFKELLSKAVKENRRLLVIGPGQFSLDGERYIFEGDPVPEGYQIRSEVKYPKPRAYHFDKNEGWRDDDLQEEPRQRATKKLVLLIKKGKSKKNFLVY